MLKAILFLCLFFVSTTVSYSDITKTEITVDYLSDFGKISNYIAGTTDAPFFAKDSYLHLKKGNFKLVQVMIWQSRPHPQPVQFEQDNRKPFSGRFMQEDLKRETQIAKMQIRSIYEIGAEPLVFMVTSNKPFDMKDYQEQIRYVINELRGAAREAGGDLLLFRFGNEPESKFFWTGNREDFFETYRVWANTVKSISPNFIVEAPGFASATARYFKDEYYDEVNGFTKEFLGYCQRNGVPLDIFSFHFYGASIKNLSKEINAVKKELSKHPTLSPIFGEPKIGVDEWNILVFGFPNQYIKIFDTSYTAAHNVGALISMLKEGVWLSIRFGGTAIGRPMPIEDIAIRRESPPMEKRLIEEKPIERSGKDFLMINSDGSPKPVYYGFNAFNEIFLTPYLLNINDKKGPIAIAGKSPDKKRLNIIMSFYDEELTGKIIRSDPSDFASKIETTTNIKIKNFPWSQVKDRVEIARFVVDDKNNLSKADTKTIFNKNGGGDIPIEFKATIPSVALIQISWQ